MPSFKRTLSRARGPPRPQCREGSCGQLQHPAGVPGYCCLGFYCTGYCDQRGICYGGGVNPKDGQAATSGLSAGATAGAVSGVVVLVLVVVGAAFYSLGGKKRPVPTPLRATESAPAMAVPVSELNKVNEIRNKAVATAVLRAPAAHAAAAGKEQRGGVGHDEAATAGDE